MLATFQLSKQSRSWILIKFFLFRSSFEKKYASDIQRQDSDNLESFGISLTFGCSN